MSGEQNGELIVYTTQWCSSCFTTKQMLKSMKVDYREIDIAKDAKALETVLQLNRGYQSVPTLVFPDGSHLTEPSIMALRSKMASYG